MATIKFKRGATDTTGTLASGEPALNTASKKLWVGYDDTNKVWVGAEIEATMASPTSALKLTTQKGIVDYIAGLGVGSGDMLLGTAQTVTAAKTFNSGTLKYAGSTSGTTTLNATAVAGTTTLVLPAADDTLVGKATTDILTNKSISGSGNTITNIANGSLTYSAVTIGSTSVSLGGTATTIAGLTSVSSTGFTGALTGNASTATALATTRAIYGNNFDGTAALTAAIAGTYGGTGVNNGANTITVAGNLSHAGAFTQTFTATGNTSVTLPTTGTLATLTGTETLTNKTLTTPKIAQINDTNGLAVLKTGTTASAVNEVTITNSATLFAPHVSATGTDTNISLHLAPKGTGKYVVVENGTDGTKQLAFGVAGATTATTTYLNAAQTADRTITLPDATDTLVGKATTDTLTNKTFNTAGTGNSFSINGTAITAVAGTGAVVLANTPTLITPNIGAATGTSLVLSGDLTVNGTTTTINSTTLTVDDKNIELGSVATPTDVTADGGGITLKGTTDKTLNWVDATDAWTSSEHFSLVTGKAYYINGTSVLNATTLGSAVVSSSLTSVGVITSGTFDGGTY